MTYFLYFSIAAVVLIACQITVFKKTQCYGDFQKTEMQDAQPSIFVVSLLWPFTIALYAFYLFLLFAVWLCGFVGVGFYHLFNTLFGKTKDTK